jgi:phage replication-related protein YjqB (UPF0714/DUF867 family)
MRPPVDRYESFRALERHAPRDVWRVIPREAPDSEVLIIAPHGGHIEIGTSELASAIAGAEYSLYCFEGLKPYGSRELHVTSHRFDDPVAVRMAERSAIVISIHGCRGHGAIHVGGLDRLLVEALTKAFAEADYPSGSQGHPYPAVHPRNICNRGRRSAGVQLEFTADLRHERHREPLAQIVRRTIDRQCAALSAASK